MKNNIKTILPLLVTLLFIFNGPASYAEENIPVPPKRPDVVKVSQSYIEQLRNGNINKDGSLKNNTPTIHAGTPRTPRMPHIEDINKNDILNILGKTPPIPTRKPGTKTATNNDSDDNTTLVSFMMLPEQIHLDENISSFLKEYAVKTLNENDSITMEIHAYARPIDNKQFSDVRLALARALEVRSFLIQQNIDPSRMKLSPVGKDSVNGSDDRIDLLFIKKNPL